MTLVEPASSLTDFALGILALMAAGRLSSRVTADSNWRWFFAWIGIAGLWGGFHHGFIIGHETLAAISWSAIILLVAVAISYLLAASVNSVLGKGRGHPLLVVRFISLAVFSLLVVSGNATVITLILTEGLAMALVIALWVHAWQKEQPGVGLVLAAIMVSMLAAALKASSVQFNLGGWEFDPNSLYHVAQMPGLLLLLIAIRRRADAMGEQPFRQNVGVAAPA
ncbi:MAG: hypothetical protein IH873_01725 [Chloroflexi bacterium]|nr:hypothetical protein [Chloroflexota bacterium]